MNEHPRIAALIVAAGRGTRAGGGTPKQYRQLAGRSVLTRTLQAFVDHPTIDSITVVIHQDDRPLYDAAIPNSPKMRPPVSGGSSRSQSVYNGIRDLSQRNTDIVLIHDAARPMVDSGVLDRVIAALNTDDGAVAMLPAVDAMRAVHDDALGENIPRDGVHRAQTPQGFRFAPILSAFEAAEAAETLDSHLDDAAVGMANGLSVTMVPGDPLNFKLTTPEDFAMAERLLAIPDIRNGQGFDVHAFSPGDHVTLCGIDIPHDKALSGHSDADVGLHALTDAILGAAAAGDIGRHFPPSDPQWKGADSAIFLAHAIEIVNEMSFTLSNVDITLMCERPKITPHSEAMRHRVGEICGLDIDRVSVKATTTERLGFCGREEGIAALASATLIRLST